MKEKKELKKDSFGELIEKTKNATPQEIKKAIEDLQKELEERE